MDDLFAQIAELEIQTQKQRSEFLELEFKICWTALDFGHTELDLRSRTVAEDEVQVVEKACGTILHFLGDIKNTVRHDQFIAELGRLRYALDGLKKRLGLLISEG
jgi:hypothetical protein